MPCIVAWISTAASELQPNWRFCVVCFEGWNTNKDTWPFSITGAGTSSLVYFLLSTALPMLNVYQDTSNTLWSCIGKGTLCANYTYIERYQETRWSEINSGLVKPGVSTYHQYCRCRMLQEKEVDSASILQVFSLHTSSCKGRSSVQQTGLHTLRNATVICLLWLMLCCHY